MYRKVHLVVKTIGLLQLLTSYEPSNYFSLKFCCCCYSEENVTRYVPSSCITPPSCVSVFRGMYGDSYHKHSHVKQTFSAHRLLRNISLPSTCQCSNRRITSIDLDRRKKFSPPHSWCSCNFGIYIDWGLYIRCPTYKVVQI